MQAAGQAADRRERTRWRGLRIGCMRRLLLAIVVFAATAAIAAGGLTAARTGGRPVALVTAETENTLLAISLDDGRVLRRVALPDDPENVVAGVGVTAVVVSARGHAVTLLDWRSLKVLTVLRDFGSPHLVAIAPSGEWAYVSDDARGQLVTIELATRPPGVDGACVSGGGGAAPPTGVFMSVWISEALRDRE